MYNVIWISKITIFKNKTHFFTLPANYCFISGATVPVNSYNNQITVFCACKNNMNIKWYSKSKMLVVIFNILYYYIIYNVVKNSLNFKFKSETFDSN